MSQSEQELYNKFLRKGIMPFIAEAMIINRRTEKDYS